MMIGMHARISVAFLLGFCTLLPSAFAQETAPLDPAKEDVAFLLEAMWHKESRIRQNAVRRLSEMTDKPFDALVPVLAKGTQIQAASAAIVLANLKTPDAAIPEKTEAAPVRDPRQTPPRKIGVGTSQRPW